MNLLFTFENNNDIMSLLKGGQYLMKSEIEKIIQDMPKVILHLHLDGSLRPETIYKWLIEQVKDVKLDEVKERLMVDKNCRDLNQYLEKFNLPVEVLQTKEHIEQATFELFEDLVRQNVIYAEVRFAPSLHTKQGLSYLQIVEAAIRGMEKAKSVYKIEGGLILCCMRGKDNQRENFETLEVAKKYFGNGVCAIDLAGAEALFATREFEALFSKAKELEIPFTIHAGEAAGAESIKKALDFGAARIGHGVRCLEDASLVEEIIQKGVVLEVCPISNLQTKATGEPHPIDKIYGAGIKTTINTDNNTVSNTSLVDEYRYVLENTGLTIEDIKKMNVIAAEAAFISEDKRLELIEKLKIVMD